MSKPLNPTQTADPNKIAIIHHAKISDAARWKYADLTKCVCLLGCVPLPGICNLNFCCWAKLKKRTYVQVHENRVETNFPHMSPCCCVQDQVEVKYFDKHTSHYARTNCCSPYHVFCCLELCGGVVSTAPSDCCNNCLCFCCRKYTVGLENPDEFRDLANSAIDAFKNGQRLTSGPSGPPQQTMQGHTQEGLQMSPMYSQPSAPVGMYPSVAPVHMAPVHVNYAVAAQPGATSA